jgi:hypothetical protein
MKAAEPFEAITPDGFVAAFNQDDDIADSQCR